MSSAELSARVLTQLSVANDAFDPPPLGEKQKRNTANVMKEIQLQRLQGNGQQLIRQRGSRYQWGEGIILNRNSRVGGNGFWSNMLPSQLEDLRQVTADHPSVFLFCYFEVVQAKLHAWAIPHDVAIQAIATVPVNKTGMKTVFIDVKAQRLSYASYSPDLSPYYREISLTASETEALAASIKQDAAAKELAAEVDRDDCDDELAGDVGFEAIYTQQTVDFLLSLPGHTTDAPWHESHRDDYARLLKDPTNTLVERLRTETVEGLDPAVAATSRNASLLRKNDFGRGGYYDHYWAAFYDPAAKSKTKSCQLFFRMSGRCRQFWYGFSFGINCDNYIVNLRTAIETGRAAVKEYLLTAPEGVVVEFGTSDDEEQVDARLFAGQISKTSNDSGLAKGSQTTPMGIIRTFPLEELPDRAEALASEIGDLFRWVWPFFDSARTGVWSTRTPVEVVLEESESEAVDEDAPKTLPVLSDLSALPIEKLQEIEDALLTKQQIVLTGPPGTSKTYIAQMFARYFAAQRDGHSQGAYSTLFMHANWAYEDFFEGIKPFTDNGMLKFEPKPGYFLEWVKSLQSFRANARHVLVLDEINRCDTAAVLGELLQLLEYRGRSVRLLSGRTFRFPSNVYIIGTMNSADRSIGRLDLALRRRFLWLDLVPDYDILRTWLGRTGNNPARFTSDALRRCNRLLEDRGIRVEQQIGHALFMVQTFGDENHPPEDKPLILEALKRIVRFSVIPYVNELCVMQFGRVDVALVKQIEQVLLECIAEGASDASLKRSSTRPEA